MAYTGTWDPKDPDERVDYVIDWSAELTAMGGDTISASTWVVDDAALVIGTGSFVPTFTDTATRVWFTGGVSGTKYSITNRITTAGGRILDQTVPLRVKTH